MTDELSLGFFFCWWWFVGFVFFFLPVHGRFLSRKENKCCKQLGELTAAQKKKQAGKSVTLTVLVSDQ